MLKAYRFFITAVLVVSAAFGQVQLEFTGGPTVCNANAVAVTSNGVIFTMIERGRDHFVYRSSDDGVNWERTNNVTSETILRLIVDENDHLHFFSREGAHVTTDYGDTWEVHAAIFPEPLLVAHGGGILAIANDSTIQFTSDCGMTWDSLYVDVSADGTISGLAVSETGAVYVYQSSGSLLVTENLGGSWTPKTAPVQGEITQILHDSGGNLYLQDRTYKLFHSSDGGATWTDETSAPHTAIIVPDGMGGLYAVESGGVQHSQDNGITWNPLPAINLFDVQLLSATVDDGGTLTVGTDYGIYRYQGSGWTAILEQTDIRTQSYAIVPLSDEKLLVDSYMGWCLYDVSSDTWCRTSRISGEHVAHSVRSDGSVYIAAGTTLYHVSDEGQIWSEVRLHEDISTIGSFFMGQQGYMYIDGGGAFWVSSDTGTTWTRHQAGISFDEGTVALDGSIVTHYLGKLWRSTDHGNTWTDSEPSIYFESPLFTSPDGGLYTAGVDGEQYHPYIFWSHDYFNTIDSGAFVNTSTISDMAWTSTGVMCVAAFFYPHNDFFPGGLFLSYDSGESYHSVNDGMPDGYGNQGCLDLYIDNRDVIYVAMASYNGSEGGLYRTISPVLDAAMPVSVTRMHLSEPYPNPVHRNSECTVTVTFPTRGYLSLALFDLNGRKMKEITAGMHEFGTFNLAFSTGDLKPGPYLLRLVSSDGIQNNLLIVR